MSKVLRIIIGVGFILTGVVIPKSTKAAWITERDLSHDWLTYYADDQAYGPLLGDYRDLKSIHFFIDAAEFRGAQLFISSMPGTSLLIDQQMVAHWPETGAQLFNMDSLVSVTGRDSIFFSVYHPEKLGALVTKVVTREVQPSEDDFLPLLSRALSKDDFIVIAALLVLAYYALLLNKFPKFMTEYNNFSRAFSLRVRDEAIFSTRIISPEVLSLLGFYSLLLAYLYHFLFLTNDSGLTILDVANGTFWTSFFNWILIALLIYLAVFLKLVLISMTNALFKIKQFVQVQVFDYLRMSHVFYLGIFFLALALYLSIHRFVDFQALTFIQLLIVFALFRGVLLYLKLKRISSYRKLQLFSYLCTTEILPLLLILKVFFIK